MISTAPSSVSSVTTTWALGSCKPLEGMGCPDLSLYPPTPSTGPASGQESNPADQHQARGKLAVSWGGLPTAKIRWHQCLSSGKRLELHKKFENVQYHSEANRVQRDSRNRKEGSREEEELP